jgi:hypothetical protein
MTDIFDLIRGEFRDWMLKDKKWNQKSVRAIVSSVVSIYKNIQNPTVEKVKDYYWNKPRTTRRTYVKHFTLFKQFLETKRLICMVKLPEKTVNKMIELVDLTVKDGKERGFYILRDGSYSEVITGDKDKVKFNSLEQKRLKAIGRYHTHPVDYFSPYNVYGLMSTGDVIAAHFIPAKLICIGTKFKNDYIIRCYEFYTDGHVFKENRDKIIRQFPIISVDVLSEVVENMQNYVREIVLDGDIHD